MPVMEVLQTDPFTRLFSKLDNSMRGKLLKLMKKAVLNPNVGKSMRFCRKGTRELYISPYRLSYSFDENKSTLTFLDLYHKDEQ